MVRVTVPVGAAVDDEDGEPEELPLCVVPADAEGEGEPDTEGVNVTAGVEGGVTADVTEPLGVTVAGGDAVCELEAVALLDAADVPVHVAEADVEPEAVADAPADKDAEEDAVVEGVVDVEAEAEPVSLLLVVPADVDDGLVEGSAYDHVSAKLPMSVSPAPSTST